MKSKAEEDGFDIMEAADGGNSLARVMPNYRQQLRNGRVDIVEQAQRPDGFERHRVLRNFCLVDVPALKSLTETRHHITN